MRPLYESRKDDFAFETICEHPYPLHVHEKAELVVVEKGTSEIIIGGENHTLHAGDIAVVFSLVAHAYGEQTDTEGYALYISPEADPRLSDILRGMQPRKPVLHPDEVDPLFFQLYGKLKDMFHTGEMQGYLYEILCITVTALALNASQPEHTDSFARPDLAFRVAQYLTAHFNEQITLEDTAAALGFNPSHISHLFSQRLGIGFRQYINALRIGNARRLLSRSSEKITDICYMCGYESPRTFHRAFYTECGMTPSEWRKKYAGTNQGSVGDDRLAPPDGTGKSLPEVL